MPLLINSSQHISDSWADAEKPTPNSVVPLAVLLETPAEELTGDSYGVRLSTADDIELLTPYLNKLGLIVVHVEKFADGRSFSFASQLKSSLKYQGELRAVGDVIPDQATFYFRCGFDQLQMRNEQEAETALRIAHNIDIQYQSDVKQALPLFKRRA